jgi:hypothetical protein
MISKWIFLIACLFCLLKHVEGGHKLVFMFLIRHNLPFEEIWQEFFEFNAPKDKYNIYIHSSDPYQFPNTSVFYNRNLPDHSVPRWGTFDLVNATRYMMKHALQDDAKNYYFMLFSESCIPVYSFSKYYRVLTANKQLSIVNACPTAFINPSTRRYRSSLGMNAGIHFWHFRKSSQWSMLIRPHAAIITADIHFDDDWAKLSVPDEHFIPTILAVNQKEKETTCSGGFTFTDWELTGIGQGLGNHPNRYETPAINEDLFYHIRYYRLANYTGKTQKDFALIPDEFHCSQYPGICHFAARKFAYSSKFQLLSKLPYLLVDDRDDLFYATNKKSSKVIATYPLNSSASYRQDFMDPSFRKRYPGYKYAEKLLPNVRKKYSEQFQQFLQNQSNSTVFYSILHATHRHHHSRRSNDTAKLMNSGLSLFYLEHGQLREFPSIESLRFFLRISPKIVTDKDLLNKIAFIADKEVTLTRCTDTTYYFPDVYEGQMIVSGDDKSRWMVRNYERHLLHPNAKHLHANSTMSTHTMSAELLDQIPVRLS